jgi:thiosulfate/3-mercaptopyruvate sulfurtransferase
VAANPLISATSLQQKLQSADAEKIIIIDCRFSLMDAEVGANEYAAGHIPGAQYANLNHDLSSTIVPGETGRHPLPDRDVFIATVGKFGITNDHTVVAYDANNGAYAARLWWMMRWLGHGDVLVLDGGFDEWQAVGYETSQEVPAIASALFVASDSLVQTINADRLLDTPYTITDARDPARFKGEVEPIDPVAGHVPGAICLPFVENLENGVFKAPEQLKAQFAAAGLSTTEPTVCYCGSGVTACHNALAICIAGLPEPILYPGSWSEWITDPARPIATGE